MFFLYIYIYIYGWWFGTFCIFPYICNNHPNRLIFFRGIGIPPTRYIYICVLVVDASTLIAYNCLACFWDSEFHAVRQESIPKFAIRSCRIIAGFTHLNCVILYYIIYYIILYIILYYIRLYHIVFYYIILYFILLY